MRLKVTILSLMLLNEACQKRGPEQATVTAEPELEVESVTHWTEKTELFVEYPPLEEGVASRFAVHLTRMSDFKSVSRGVVEVRLTRAGGQAEVFRVEAPGRPGIFGVEVKPKARGEVRMAIVWISDGREDVHDLGGVSVAARGTPRKATPGGEEEEITFLKEQQWILDFSTVVATERALQGSIRVPAEVMARSGGDAEVATPFDGRVVFDRAPIVGMSIEAGQILASLVLPTNAAGDLPTLELAKAESAQSLELASRDRMRAERLTAAGAVPARRLEEARTLEANLAARLRAAEARLAQYESSRTADDGPLGGKRFAVRAPIGGILEAIKTAPGANVKAGEALFRIVDLDEVFVAAIVPESEFPRVATLSGAELEIPGVEQVMRLTKLVRVGRVVDAVSRTFPVIYALNNRDRRVAINQTVYVRLLFAPGKTGPVLPESALVDDGGRPIVFVQSGGESFVRRSVTAGNRAGGMVEILAGVARGERVVSRGAHLIRLAAMSSQIPTHGHVH